MGQYYNPVILDKNKKTVLKWFNCHEYGSLAKLMEHSWMLNDFVGAVEKFLLGNPQHVVWAGDYADEDKGLKTNVYSRCKELTEVKPNEIPAQLVKAKYIVNHTKKEFINKSKVPSFDDGWRIHPLPLMTCEGNGRGGGDFRDVDKQGIVGTWARDLISVEVKKPEGFKEILFDLAEGPLDKDVKKQPEPTPELEEQEFEIEVTRYYVVTDNIKVKAASKEEAKEKAETESDNKDYTGQLGLDHVTTEIV